MTIDSIRAGGEENDRLFCHLKHTFEAVEGLYDCGVALGEAFDNLAKRSQVLLVLVEAARLIGQPCRQRHWDMVQLLSHKELPEGEDTDALCSNTLAAKEFSELGNIHLHEILNSHLLSHIDELRGIFAQASLEINHETRLSVVRREWERTRLTFAVSPTLVLDVAVSN